MHKLLAFLIAFAFLMPTNVQAQDTTGNATRLQWWQDGKFGLFLHWGLYSIGHWNGKKQNGNEHFMYFEKIPVATYGKLADSLTLQNYNPDDWAKRAKAAGMKYIVITAKHHDGFAMFNSPSNDFNIVKRSPYHKDPMTGLAAACKKYGLKLCFYYSLGRDWESPNTVWNKPGAKSGNTWDYPDESKKDYQRYIDEKVKPQLKELLTQYGPVGIIWFDTPEGTAPAQSADLRQWIHSLQPACIINSRIGNGNGDYLVSEQKIASGQEVKPWEACITMSGKWGYSRFDSAWKTPELLVRQLVEIVCKGGNLLLNVGPTNLGDMPSQSITNLKAIGTWMKQNSEAIYGTKPWTVLNENGITEKGLDDAMGKSDNDFTSKTIQLDLYFNQKGNNIYLFARSWTSDIINLKSLAGINIKSITLLGSKEKIKWEQGTNVLQITMPRHLPNGVPVYVFKINS